MGRRSFASSVLLVILFAVSVLLPQLLFAQETAQDGLWSDPEVWDGGVVPGDGDSVIIKHFVEVDQDTIVGESLAASGASAVVVESGASLTVNVDILLTVRGNVILEDSTLAVRAGSIFEFDASQAIDPAATMYRLQIGSAHNQDSLLHIQGRRSNRSIIRSSNVNGAAAGYINDGGFLAGGLITGTYVDFIDIGDATTPAVKTAVFQTLLGIRNQIEGICSLIAERTIPLMIWYLLPMLIIIVAFI